MWMYIMTKQMVHRKFGVNELTGIQTWPKEVEGQ